MPCWVLLLLAAVGGVSCITFGGHYHDAQLEDDSALEHSAGEQHPAPPLELRFRRAVVPGLVFDHNVCQLYSPPVISGQV